MPRRAPRVCSTPGCPTLTTGTRCPEHTRQYDKEHRSVNSAFYGSKRWRATRRNQLRRQPWCEYPGCVELATEVDHIDPLPPRGTGDPYKSANLRSLCKPDHSRVGRNWDTNR